MDLRLFALSELDGQVGTVFQLRQMQRYSFSEMADMHLMYGRANGNALAAQRLYREMFPNRRVPHRQTFEAIDRRLRETGTFSAMADRGRQREVLQPALEERVLNDVERNPQISTRRAAARAGVSPSTIWRLHHEQLLHPWHLQRVHALQRTDYPARRRFCQWFVRKCTENPAFTALILFTDEAGFTRDGIHNVHNQHVWADENPHQMVITHHQQQFSVNVWAGIIGNYLLGPYFLPRRLTGERYLRFLQYDLPGLLEDVPLEVRLSMWFMHDGAPPHFLRRVRAHITETFQNRWIGRGGPISWPARSQDF